MDIKTPLKAPDGWIRTRPVDHQSRSAWKKNFTQYSTELELELKRIGVKEIRITRNPEGDRDPGVSVWFARTKKEDFSWQNQLALLNPYPELEEIRTAYRNLAAKYHTDNQDTGDIELYHGIQRAYKEAMAWYDRRGDKALNYAIAADTFKEARWNLMAIVGTLKAIRTIQRLGTSALMEKTLQGFQQLPEKKEAHVETTA